ncbi:MAG TPA: LamG domain-containing protein [Microlunatus sp.]|nr:LamG domain-containing protein [Microlunatus sp.]
MTAADGPSSDAWGLTLTAPMLVSHQSLLLAFAREQGRPSHTLYFQVYDPTRSVDAADESGWSGWYRFDLPGAPARGPVGTAYQQQQPAPELRLAGMDLLTVTPAATAITPADASFQVVSDDRFLMIIRPTVAGTCYLNRLVLQSWTDEVAGVNYPRYALEVAWEVRYQRSGLRDVPLDATDSLSSRDLTGAPFLEPTIELSHIAGAASGAFGVARVPTADQSTVRWYVATTSAAGIRLSCFTQTDDTVTDFTESAAVYPLLTPSCQNRALTPIAGLAPTLVPYAEQDAATDPSGNPVEVQRAGRLMLAVAVSGTALSAGLPAATVVYDFGLDQTGTVPVLPADEQSVQLVDGAVVGGVFQPDETSEAFPTPAQALQVTRVIGGQVVTSMLLGQLQPHTDLSGRMAEDGLVHLYSGGPPATADQGEFGWRALVPGQPQAMVAQLDPRVSRVVLPASWAYPVPAEQPAGTVQLVARQSGPVMTGSTLAISDATLGSGASAQPQPDLCTVEISYPSAVGLGPETWRGVPREVSTFAAVLNGQATDDSADPAALTGARPFFDFTGTHPLARLPLTPPLLGPDQTQGAIVGHPPIATVVTDRPSLPLSQVVVAKSGSSAEVTMTFQAAHPITAVWPALPTDAGAWADIFAGSAAGSVYPYTLGAGSSTLFGLPTNAYQIDAAVLFLPTSAAGDLSALTIEVAAAKAGGLNVTVVRTPPAEHQVGDDPNTFTVPNVPAAVAQFATALMADTHFAALGLVINIDGAAGQVLPTGGPVGRLDLRGSCALFDWLAPAGSAAGSKVAAGTYAAGSQQHVPASGPVIELTRTTGFGCIVADRPVAGIPAYVQNRAADLTAAGISRQLGSGGLASGSRWIRETPPQSCSFDGTDSVSVPVGGGNGALPASLNLLPQPEWTLETWLQPSSSAVQRVITFHGTGSATSTGLAPDYTIGVEGQDVIQFSSYAKKPGEPDSAYFQTGTSSAAEFLRPGAFTWECWIQPTAPPAPAGALGGIVQVQLPDQTVTAFGIGVDPDRHLVISTSPDGDAAKTFRSVGAVPATNRDGLPTWTHVAVTAEQRPVSATIRGGWTLSLYVDAVLDSVVTDVVLQDDQRGASLIIGANTADDVAMFGKIAALRFWATARTVAEVRRTAFVGMAGNESGLLGCWPMTSLVSGGPTTSHLPNTAVITGTDWDAAYYSGHQPVAAVQDDFFLSVVASIAGLPPVEAHAALANDRWNHLAVVLRAGGALALNPKPRFDLGQLDWARCPGGKLNPGLEFAIDAWIQLPDRLPQDATIIAHWAWDSAPDDQSFALVVDAAGNLALSVKMRNDDHGGTTIETLRSSGVDLADGGLHHVAVTFAGHNAGKEPDSTAGYTITAYADGRQIGNKSGTVGLATLQLLASQTDVLIGRSNLAPDGVIQPIESLNLFRGTLGQLRYWSALPSVQDLFPETAPTRPRFGPPAGLAAVWSFRDGQGLVAVDSVGGSDAVLTSSAPWSSLRVTSTVEFVANGTPVRSVEPYTALAPLTPAVAPQFSLGAPKEAGTKGLTGDLGSVALWARARSLAEIRDQMHTPRSGDEADLLAYWDFSQQGKDLTGGGNNPSPAIATARIRVDDVPVSNEGAVVRNVYGGLITDRAECTAGRIAVGSYAHASSAGTRQARAVVKRQYLMDPNASLTRPIEVGQLDLIYVGQVQTDPTLIGYIEGAPPVPSENLSRPYYQSPASPLYTFYAGSTAVTLTQQSSQKVAFSSTSTTTTDIDFKAAIGLFGISERVDLNLLLISNEEYDLKNTVQAVAAAKATYGASDQTALAGEWTATQLDTLSLNGDWESYQSDPERYLNKQVGRRYVPANQGYALVESLTGDLFAMINRATKAAVGTIIIPNLAIPPDRNLLIFPMDTHYTRNGSLDGRVGLVDDPDARRGSYFRPTEAYGLAASIEAQNERRRAYAAQFDWRGRGQRSNADLSDVRSQLPIDFDAEPGSGNQAAVPTAGIANRYVWSADMGFHAETEGYAGVSTRSYTGWRSVGGGGGIKAAGEFFHYFGFAWSLDLLVSHMVDVHIGLTTETQQSVSLDVTAVGETYLPAWDPAADAVYGTGKGAFSPGSGVGKVQQYRFFSFLLPASRSNAEAFDHIVDPVWKQMSNDPTARAMRELTAANPVWRVLHRVTYVERVPPPVSSRPVYTAAIPVAEPVNLPGNRTLLTLICDQITSPNPTGAQIGTAVAAAINPAPTEPGIYPPALLEAQIGWWRTFLNSARPGTSGPAPNPQAAALLNALVHRVVDYVTAGYRTEVLMPGSAAVGEEVESRFAQVP